MATNQKHNEEEVDLGSLFVIIGKGFSNFFNFIGSIFKGIFHQVLLFFLFIKKHVVKFILAALIGAIIGSYFEFTKKDLYEGAILLEPNFNSSKQLYKNINYYNNLLAVKDTTTLGKIFNISSSKASSLKSFEIIPVKTENDIISSYFYLMRTLDTLGTKNYEYAQFKKEFTDFDYYVHEVKVTSSDSKIFTNLELPIISSIKNNSFYANLLNSSNEDLKRKDSNLTNNLIEIDTLRKVYKEVLLEEAKKESSGTIIDMAKDGDITAKEILLFRTNREIDNQLSLIKKDIVENSEVVNIVSNFPEVGAKVGGLTKNYIIICSILSMFFVLVVLSLINFNNYLDNYKNK